ncbi:hypothetical protein [Metapseudomonas otitidis]|uniref:hypothetical protein n=1 Tax=Metapseudomonas otitidis TaxID=319939 RepID=UPI001F2EED34|nr:hypothetical protein [Pseudomonas otitidis]MDG9783690.1 hypothetical protein [Pseudomonas otitidis]
MMRRILGLALSVIPSWFSAMPVWVPRYHCLQAWPQARPGKSGVAAARRAARKLRNRRRLRHGRA